MNIVIKQASNSGVREIVSFRVPVLVVETIKISVTVPFWILCIPII